MSKGSYRGGSSLMGWNANVFVSGSGRGVSRRQRLKALSTRTAQTPSESAETDDAVRRRHGLKSATPAPVTWAPTLDAGFVPDSDSSARQRRLSRTSAPVVVVKLKKRKAAAKPPKRLVSMPAGKGRRG